MAWLFFYLVLFVIIVIHIVLFVLSFLSHIWQVIGQESVSCSRYFPCGQSFFDICFYSFDLSFASPHVQQLLYCIADPEYPLLFAGGDFIAVVWH